MGAFGTIPGDGSPQPAPFPVVEVGSSSGGTDAAAVTAGFGEVESWVGDVASWIGSVVSSLFSSLVSELQKIFTAIWNWLKSLADTWLGHLIQTVWNAVKTIYERVKAIVEEILCYFRFLQQLQDYYFNQFIKPILQVIASLRRVLVIFRLFHLKFAEELDSWLAAREAQLTKIFLLERGELNRIIDYLNYIVNPFGLVNEGLYMQSALQSITQLWAALKGVGDVKPGAGTLQQQATYSTYFTAKNAATTMNETAASGLQPIDAANFAAASQQLTALGYQQ